MTHWHRHPGVRSGDQLTAAERAVDVTVRAMGSLRFLAAQTVVVAIWIALNLAAVQLRWDPYPFILLNLAFSTQAAYATPLILLAQGRQDVRSAEVATHTMYSVDSLHEKVDALAYRGSGPQ